MKITKGELKQIVQEEVARVKKIKALQEQKSKIDKMLNEMEMGDMSSKKEESLEEVDLGVMAGPESIQALGDVAVAALFSLPFIGVAVPLAINYFKKNKDKAVEIASKVKGGDTKGAMSALKPIASDIKASKDGLEEMDLGVMAGPESIQALGDVAVATLFSLPFVGVAVPLVINYFKKNKDKAIEIASKVKGGDTKGAMSLVKPIASDIKASKEGLEEMDMASGMVGAEAIASMPALQVIAAFLAPAIGIGSAVLYQYLKGKGKEKAAQIVSKVKTGDIAGATSLAKEIAPEVK